ncbi:MAG: branched-chain amino acid ABC transporter permease [Candidatus Omnitrophica bacterium]|nr:branched-chain amino acid ABC transporter permease [Candidatus Omnitrophota bacterium]
MRVSDFFKRLFRRHPFSCQVALFLLPFSLFPLIDKNVYHIDLMTSIGIYVLLAMGLNVVVGFAGLLNLGYAAFFAIGAYAYALLNLHAGCPFWLGLPAAGIVSMIFGLVIGAPSIRIRGDYLAITTLGFGEIVRIAFNNLDEWTGGPNGLLGIARPKIWVPRFEGGFHWETFSFSVNPTPYFYLVLGLVMFAAYLLFRMSDSKIGRALVAIREDELAASCMGVPVLKIKLTAFGLSAFIAGMAGAVFASKQTIVTPDSFDFVLSVLILAMVVLGGMGNIWGAALGALILGALPELLREFANYRMLLFGVMMVLMMIFRPQGILGSQLIRREMRTEKSE